MDVLALAILGQYEPKVGAFSKYISIAQQKTLLYARGE